MQTNIEELFATMLQLGKLMSKDASFNHENKTATMLQFQALRFVLENKNTAVSDLGGSLTLSKSSATQLIERLVKAGFLERVHDEQDRRIVRLTITKLGKQEYEALKQKMLEKVTGIFSNLPEEDIKELIRIHKKLLAQLESK